MSEQGETTLGPKLFQKHRAGFTTQRILQARRRQSDSCSPVSDLAPINENNVANSTTSSSTSTTPEVQNEEPPTGFFRRAFRSRQLRGSFRERELEDLDAKANQYSKQVKESTERTSYSTPATPEVMHESSPFGGRKLELFRRSSVPADLEELEEPNHMNQYTRSFSDGQSQFGDDFRESIVAQLEAQRSSVALSGLASIKQRHAMMAQKFQRMLSSESEDPEGEVANGDDQPSDILQQMSGNPRLASIYQRITSLGLNKPQPSSLPPIWDHIDTLDCDKPKSRTAFDRSSSLRESISKRPTTAVNQIPEVSSSFDSSPAEREEQFESQALPRKSYLTTKHSIGSANSDISSPSYSVTSLKRQPFKSGARKSLLDEDQFLTTTNSDILSPTYETRDVEDRFDRIEPESNFLASMQALREQISNLHLSNGTKESHSPSVSGYTNGVQGDAYKYGSVANAEMQDESQLSDMTITDHSSLNQTELNNTFTLETSPKAEKSPERQVLGAEKTVKKEKLTPKKNTTRNEKPIVRAGKQTAKSEKPAVKTEKPVMKNQKPDFSHKPIIKTEKRSVRNDTPIKKEKPVVKNEKTPVKNERQTRPRTAVRASSATLSVGSSSITRMTASLANKKKAIDIEKKEKTVKGKTFEKNTKGPGTLKDAIDKPKEGVLSPSRVRKFNDNLAHGGSGVLDVRVTSTDTISSGRNSLESQTDSNQAASDNTDEVFMDDKNFVTNLDREASLSVDSIEGAEKTVELADIKRLAATRRSVRSTSSDYSASYGGRSSSSPGKFRKQISDVSGRLKSFVKKQQHSKGAHREDPDGEEVQSGGYSDGEVKRRSTSDLSLSSSANTGMSRRSSLWSEAKPITDPTMRSKLRSASGARVNAKDQRILELMMKKREEAQRQQQLRETTQMAWEEEKERSLKSRSESSSRRSSFAEPRSKSQPRIKGRNRLLSTGSSSPRTPRKTDIDDGKSCDKTPSSVSLVMLERERKLLEKKKANLERKKSQEQRLAEQEREKALQNSQIKAKQEQDLRRAEKLKEVKEKEDAKQRRMKSYYVKKKQEEKLHQIRKQSEEEQEQLAAALDQKMAIAETNLQARQERRTDLESRLEQSRQNQKRMQEEMHNWHAELQNYRKMMDEKAKDQTRRQLEEKRARAAEDLALKKSLQQENMQRLLEQEDEWKNDVEATIAMKDARSKMIAMEKDELLKESRSLAQASQLLREELRMSYEIDHIDKMNRQAELEARIQKPL